MGRRVQTACAVLGLLVGAMLCSGCGKEPEGTWKVVVCPSCKGEGKTLVKVYGKGDELLIEDGKTKVDRGGRVERRTCPGCDGKGKVREWVKK